jgi:hypothetical protein
MQSRVCTRLTHAGGRTSGRRILPEVDGPAEDDLEWSCVRTLLYISGFFFGTWMLAFAVCYVAIEVSKVYFR